ncbi:MAG: hypothetical protein ACM3MI_12230 [Clostridiales bacterium]
MAKFFGLTLLICGLLVTIAGIFSESESPAMIGGFLIFAAFVFYDLLSSKQ